MNKQRQKKSPSRLHTSLPEETQDLILDDIYNSDDPEVKDYLSITFFEEMKLAHERALLKVATRFKHTLSPQMQKLVDTRVLPASQVALG